MWCKMHVLFHSDNDAVVRYARTSKVPSLMRLLHSLLLAATRHSFSFSAQHVPGVNNQIADALSHFRCQDFRQLVLDAQPHPTWIPPGTSGGFDIFTLEQQCYSVLTQGLAPSNCCSYASPQAKFISFCHQLNGNFALSSLLLLGPFSIPLSRCTYLKLELSTLIKGSHL